MPAATPAYPAAHIPTALAGVAATRADIAHEGGYR